MTDLAIREQKDFMPAMTIDDAAQRYNMVVEFTKRMMKKDKDYGVIPGTGTKPTLLKPGAEKLCSLFGLYPEFETLESITDFEKGLFYFRQKCTLYRNGDPVASGIGSCNSKEKKYRYRYVPENRASDDEKANAVSAETKSGKYGTYKVLKVENTEPFELVNTIDKMAQKRALVAATLIGANASEFFTQDIEDMDFVEGDYTPVEYDPPTPVPAPKAKPKPVPAEGIDRYDFQTRPYDAETLKAALTKKSEKIGTYTASDKQRNFLGSLLSEYFQDDNNRHVASAWLFGSASTKEIDGAMVKAALDWLAPEKDDGGAYHIEANAKTELSHLLTAALEAQGQQALL